MSRFLQYIVEFYYYVEALPDRILIVLLFVLANFLIFLFLLLFLLSVSIQEYFLTKKVNYLKPQLRNLFVNILENPTNYTENEIKSSYKKLIQYKTKSKIEISINVLLSIKDIYTKDEFNRLFCILKFDKHLKNTINTLNVSKKFKAINLIKELELETNTVNISHYTTDKNSYVRNEAKTIHFLMKDYDLYTFFNSIEGEVTQWNVIEFMKLLERRYKKGELTDLGTWIQTTKKTSLQCFLIKAIAHFKQIENQRYPNRKNIIC